MTFIQEKQKEARERLGKTLLATGAVELDSIIATTIQDTIEKAKALLQEHHRTNTYEGEEASLFHTTIDEAIETLTRLSEDV